MWLASLDILDFLPIETKNAENGLIVTGHGKPPGGDTEYRATILIVDAAIDASALKLSLLQKMAPQHPIYVKGSSKRSSAERGKFTLRTTIAHKIGKVIFKIN